MSYRSIFALIVSFWHFAKANTPVIYMFLGCESHESDNAALHQNLKQALRQHKTINLADRSGQYHGAFLVSQSGITGLLKLHGAGALSKFSEYETLKQNFTIYEITNVGKQNYYLFVAPKDIRFFSDILNINKLAKQSFEKLSQLAACQDLYSTDYKALIETVFKKNAKESVEPIAIYMIGHGFEDQHMSDRLSTLPTSSLSGDESMARLQERIIDYIKQASSDSIRSLYHLDIVPRTPKELRSSFKKETGIDVPEENIVALLAFAKNPAVRELLFRAYKQKALIANMDIDSFSWALSYLDRNIPIKTVFLTTCFSGSLNALVPYTTVETINSPHLHTTYSFDIINASSQGGVVHGPDMFELMNIFLTPGFLHKNLDEFLSKSVFLFYYKYYSPMIRPKNQPYWFSIFKNYSSTETGLATFDITKELVDAYNTEGRSFVFSKLFNSIFITTPCITVPVIFQSTAIFKPFIARVKTLFMDSLTIYAGFDSDFTSILRNVLLLFIEARNLQDPISLDALIGIKKLRLVYADGHEEAAEDVVLSESPDKIFYGYKKGDVYTELIFNKKYLQEILNLQVSVIKFSPSTVEMVIKQDKKIEDKIVQLEQQCSAAKVDLTPLSTYIQKHTALVSNPDLKRRLLDLLQEKKAKQSEKALAEGQSGPAEHQEKRKETARKDTQQSTSDATRSELNDKIAACLKAKV